MCKLTLAFERPKNNLERFYRALLFIESLFPLGAIVK